MPEKVIGQRLPMVDAVAKVTGECKYADDLQIPGMLTARLLRSPYPHALISNIDIAAASRLPGVRLVVTGAQAPACKYGRVVKDQQVLAREKVRFIGEEVAAVVADDEDTAEEALRMIKVEYEPLPSVFDPEAALQAGAPLIHAGGNLAKEYHIKRGEPEAYFARAYAVFEDEISAPTQSHCCLEQNIVLADCDAQGWISLMLPTARPFATKTQVVDGLGIPSDRVRVTQTMVGGGFGGKVEQSIYSVAAFLALLVRKPIKLKNSREEEFLTSLPRVPMRVHLKTAFSKDGLFLAKQSRIVADNGAYTYLAPKILEAAATRPDCLYRVRNLRTDAYLVYTNKVPTNMFRGFGNLQSTFALETHLDRVASELGIDPVELRLKNATQKGDITAHGWKVKECGMVDCLEEVRVRSDWAAKRLIKRPGYGIGLACCVHVSGNRGCFPDFEGSSALIKMDYEGKVEVATAEIDEGQGMRTIFAQIVSEEVGVPIQDIRVELVDTRDSPFGLGTFGDRATTLGGAAVLRAARDLREKLLQHVRQKGGLKEEEGEFEVGNGVIFCPSRPEMKWKISELARELSFKSAGLPIMGEGFFIPEDLEMPDDTLYGNISCSYDYAAQVAEVEVDPATGQVKVLSLTCAHDVGKALNPMLLEGQIEGAVAQGIGYLLMEDYRMNQGLALSPSLMDYGVPTAGDVPDVVKSFFPEGNLAPGPYGAKGVAEPALIPTPAAIANAIRMATGVKVGIPYSPAQIRSAGRFDKKNDQ